MACKNCDARLADLVRLETDRNQQKERADFNCERADELQEACNRYKEEGRATWVSLQKELVKPSVEELLKTASAAAQIAVLIRKLLPVSPVSDEASSVARTALKQVLERLEEKEGAEDAGSHSEG